MTNITGNVIDLENLLEFIRESRGFDFSGYKRTSLVRRLEKRMRAVGIDAYRDYTNYLEVHPDEFTQLFNSILINVTSFFRDPESWEYLDQKILPAITTDKRPNEPIRVWSAGCASGEETCSIAILLAEHLGMERFKGRVKIYSTDLDDEALASARQAVYSYKAIQNVPEKYVEKYFENNGGAYTFNKDLRRLAIFGRHDLVQDAPISHIDLLLCRNVLMYFNSEVQTHILARLNYAINDNGFLFLGKAEMLLTHGNLFSPVSIKNRIFRKSNNTNLRGRLLEMPQIGNSDEDSKLATMQAQLRDAAFEKGPEAQIVIDQQGVLLMINEKARSLFHLNAQDIGRPFQDLELSYRPAELRSLIEEAHAKGKQIALEETEYSSDANGERCYLNVNLVPLKNEDGKPSGVSISFSDISDQRRLQNQIEHTNQELETAMEELQTTNEELETTNEELQSTIEELETTNEELQSTIEELETTNEELETTNDELNERTDELNQVNSFLGSILTRLRGEVIVLNNDRNIIVWNSRSEDMWGLHPNEAIDHNLFSLDIGLPVDRLKGPVQSVLTGEKEIVNIEMAATNRRGRNINLKVSITPLITPKKEMRGAILLVEQVEGVSESEGTG